MRVALFVSFGWLAIGHSAFAEEAHRLRPPLDPTQDVMRDRSLRGADKSDWKEVVRGAKQRRCVHRKGAQSAMPECKPKLTDAPRLPLPIEQREKN